MAEITKSLQLDRPPSGLVMDGQATVKDLLDKDGFVEHLKDSYQIDPGRHYQYVIMYDDRRHET